MTVDEEVAAIFGGTVIVVLVVGATEKEAFSTISVDDFAAMRLSEMFSCSFS